MVILSIVSYHKEPQSCSFLMEKGATVISLWYFDQSISKHDRYFVNASGNWKLDLSLLFWWYIIPRYSYKQAFKNTARVSVDSFSNYSTDIYELTSGDYKNKGHFVCDEQRVCPSIYLILMWCSLTIIWITFIINFIGQTPYRIFHCIVFGQVMTKT